MPRDNVRLHAHAGVEFIYTLKGRLNVHIDGQEHTLEAGDSMIRLRPSPWLPPRRRLNMWRIVVTTA